MQTTARADAYQFQLAEFGLFFTGLEVDVCQGVQFVHHNVDIVATDARGDYRDAFAFVCTGYGLEFAAFYLAFFVLEVGCDQCHASGVAYQDYFICQPFGLYVEVENGTVIIDNQFGRCKILFHITRLLFA